MKLSLVVVGRLKNGPEKDLYARYFDRLLGLGKGQGLTSVTLTEISESRASRPTDRKADEAKNILSKIDPDAFVIILDERGKSMSSESFAQSIAKVRDRGINQITFIIGGAEGLDQSIKDRADQTLGFGAMTWPHQIVRVMLVEQLYRAMTILAGHPYHKS